MESLQPPASFHVATTQRTSIPLRSILNVEDGRGSAQEVPSTTPPPPPPPPSEIEVFPAKKLAVQRSQFLFVNTHDTSRPNARLRQDQKVINAHVQHTSHRKRRAAAIDRLKQTLRLCRQCAESRPYRLVAALERPSSPSSSASESSPASTSTSVGSGPLRRPLQIGTSSTHLCGQCGTSLQNPPRSHTEQDGRQRAVGTTSPMKITLASAKEKAPPLTLFVEEQPTSLLDTGMIDPFATSSVSMNMEMNGVLIHCESAFVMSFFTSVRAWVWKSISLASPCTCTNFEARPGWREWVRECVEPPHLLMPHDLSHLLLIVERAPRKLTDLAKS